MRYEKKGGLRPLPAMVARPWALSSYTRLMAKSSVKSCLHEQLKLHGCIPPGELQKDTATDLPMETRLDEALSASGAMRVSEPIGRKSQGSEVRRPTLLDAIMEAEYSGVGWDRASEAAKKIEKDNLSGDEDSEEGEEDKALRDRFSMQFQHVVPDEAFAAGPQNALLDPSRLATSGRQQQQEDEMVLPGRWWGSTRRMFFRHQHRAYRLIDDRWQQVADPRGPQHKPKRRYKPRPMEREERLQRAMKSQGQRSRVT